MLTDTLRALFFVANDWHSGQTSRGYRLLCMAQRALARRSYTTTLDWPLSDAQKTIYLDLEARYADAL